MSDASSTGGWPDVDVVVPVRDEADHLAAAVAAVRAQDYPGELRTFLAVAPSDDGTEALAARIAAAVPDVTVVPNPDASTPAGLNAAIRTGSAPIVVRVDGHSRLPKGYVRRAVETLRRTGAVNVGGRQVPTPSTPFERAVAAATTSWLGTGGATYRVGGDEGPVDTVFLGVFDRSSIERAGLFDERLLRNQDYELNVRLRRDGGTVWFDPELAVGYRPRGSWRALARQYLDYGRWKAVVLRRHPGSVRLRQLLPPVALVGVVASLLLARRRPRLLAVPAAAAAIVVGGAARIGRREGAPVASLAGVLALIPTAWSLGFLVGLVECTATDDEPGGEAD